MYGLVQGETSTTTRPVLVFYCRSGQFLVDPASASYRIENITVPTATTPTTVVATTVLDLTTAKIGVGRYAIPTPGAGTSAWVVGSHRVVVTYTLVASGPTITQVIPFEVLGPMEWVTGVNYRGYVSTREMYVKNLAIYGTDAVGGLQAAINEASRQLEMWTGRAFHPVYKTVDLVDRGGPIAFLPEPPIAVEDVYTMSHGGTLTATPCDEDTYRVRNDHLDGNYVGEDPRVFMRLEWTARTLSDNSPHVDRITADYLPSVRVFGVFGYTDPEDDPTRSATLLGSTPAPIAHVCGVWAGRLLSDWSLTNTTALLPGTITGMRTRDQSITRAATSASSVARGSGSFTGDPTLDAIIRQYVRPSRLICA